MPRELFYRQLPRPSELVDCIFKDGSTACVAYAGSFLALARNGVWFKRVAGTSAGAIPAATIAAGYDANEFDYHAAPKGLRKAPPDNFPFGVEPMDYLSVFSDMPLSPREVTLDTRRSIFAYRLLDGSLLNELSKLQVPVPALDSFVDKITEEVFKKIPVQIGPKKFRSGHLKQKQGLLVDTA